MSLHRRPAAATRQLLRKQRLAVAASLFRLDGPELLMRDCADAKGTCAASIDGTGSEACRGDVL